MNVYQYKVYFVQDAERLHEMSLKDSLSLLSDAEGYSLHAGQH